MVEMHRDVAISVKKYDKCTDGMTNPIHERPGNVHDVIWISGTNNVSK
jgi:hypothetical protein